MASSVSVGGINYPLPLPGSIGWGSRISEILIALATETNPVSNSLEYVSVKYGAADPVTAIEEALSAAQDYGLKRIHLGDGRWAFDANGQADDGALVTIPDGFQVTGNGPGRTILSIINTTRGAGDLGVAIFRTALNACNVLFSGLHFIGDNGTDEDTFSDVLNNQNNCIDVDWRGTSKDIVVQNCRFEQVWGFTVHDRQGTHPDAGGNVRIHYVNNAAINCANGCNINASYCVFDGHFENSEGYESSGAYNRFYGTFKNALGVAVTVGGNQDPGASFPGNVVVGVTVDGGTGVAFTITDSAHGTQLIGCQARHCADGAIVINGSVNPPVGTLVLGGEYDSNCTTGGSNINGINVQAGSRHIFVAVQCADSADTGFRQRYGINITAPDCQLWGGYYKGTFGDGHDASFGNGATNTKHRGCTFANNSLEVIGSATVDPERITSKAATDYVESSRLGTDSVLDAYSRYARQADGLVKLGPGGGDVHDVTYGRTGVGLFGTSGKLTAAQGLGVGNSASATTPGTVVRKMEVFDASGASLGFVAIFDAIT